MSENRTYEEAKEALDRLYSNTSVSRAVTRELLGDLRDEIDLLLETLDDA